METTRGMQPALCCTPTVVCTLPQLLTQHLNQEPALESTFFLLCRLRGQTRSAWPRVKRAFIILCLEAMLLDLRCIEAVQVPSPRTEVQSSSQCSCGCWALSGPGLQLLCLTGTEGLSLSPTAEQVSVLTGQTAGSAEAEQLKPHPVFINQGQASNTTNAAQFFP